MNMSGRFNLNPRIFILIGIILIFLIASTSLILFPSNPPPDLGNAPKFTVPTVKGNNYSLEQDLGSRMIIVDFMATWCNPCLEIGNVYREILDEHGDNISIVSITIFEKDSASILGNWSSAWSFDWTFIPYGSYTSSITNAYGVDIGIPASYFIDISGIIRVSHLGLLTKQTVENWINGIYS